MRPLVLSPKKIRIIAFAFALPGLFVESLPFFSLKGLQISKYLALFREFFSTLHLYFFNVSTFQYYNHDTNLNSNFINVIFYSLLLAGAILHKTSKEKETRLLRFGISIVFISALASSFWRVIFIIFFSKNLDIQNYWLLSVLITIKDVAVASLCYLALTHIRQSKTPDTYIQESENGPQLFVTESGRWQRLAHLVLDTLLCIFIFSWLATIVGRSFFSSIEELAGEKISIYIFLLITRLIYYPFFEMILGATPAKLLTESVVLNESGQKPAAKVIMLRTLARHIPFESFSFFGGRGWHDGFTNTWVVKEKKTGVPADSYLLIIPAVMILAFGMYWGKGKYEEHKEYVQRKTTHEERIKDLQKQLDQLSTSSVIEISNAEPSTNDDIAFLKIDSIAGDNIWAVRITSKVNYSNSLLPIERAYEAAKKSLPVFSLKRSDLQHALTADYDKYWWNERNSVDFFKDGKKYEIDKIDRLFQPSIHSTGGGSWESDGYAIMSFCNVGRPATVVGFETIEGDIQFSAEQLPIDAPTVIRREDPLFYIRGTGFTEFNRYKFRMIVEDVDKKKYRYIVEGVRTDRKIYREE